MTENNYQYLMSGTRLTNYSAIPNKVCNMNISSTAKVIYAKLLNRAQFSDCNRAENKPYKGSKTAFTTGGKLTPSYSNNNKKEIPNYEYREGDSL